LRTRANTGERRRTRANTGEHFWAVPATITGDYRLLPAITNYYQGLPTGSLSGPFHQQLPAITGDYPRLPAIAGNYRTLPAITGHYRPLPVITGDYQQLPLGNCW
jgi:hypothetical protein